MPTIKSRLHESGYTPQMMAEATERARRLEAYIMQAGPKGDRPLSFFPRKLRTSCAYAHLPQVAG